jgi:hypothetical protein
MSVPSAAAPLSAPTSFDAAHVDYSALTEPITRAQVRAFRAQIRTAQRTDPAINTVVTTAAGVLSVTMLAVFAVIFGIVFIGGIGSAIGGGDNIGVVPIVVLGVVVVATVLLVRYHFGANGTWGRWMRMDTFARMNGLQFRNRSANPNYAGMIFSIGDTRSSFNHFNSTSGRYFDLGNYQYSIGSGKSRATKYWGYLALHLDRRLPNMVLDSRENNTLFGSDLPTTFSRDQILSLEGDFDKHFTLYCPKEYEQDALYVFTPDLMALLIDDAGSYDVEIVDDWMFIYSPHQLPGLSPATYQRLFTIIQTVGARTVTQTANYHDDRVASPGANFVAPQGQRLRHGTSVGALLIVGLIVVGWTFATIHGW